MSKKDILRISGGLQDNGSVRSWWNWGGDGLQNLINPAIMSYGGERLNRSTNSAQTGTAISPAASR